MPRVKIDYVLSFSNEDPENPASNLLEREVTKKKWLCTKGEPSVSVVLQLVRAVQISAVHIGAFQSALVEVLVGRSENPDEPFQVLVPSSVFLSPSASRKDEASELVRSFSGAQLAAPAKDQKWDRVRVVCSQPYNKHCKYGLGFVHIYEPEGPSTASALPTRMLALDVPSSDEEEFRPGELFAKHSQGSSTSDESKGAPTTGAQIRQATSQALKNLPGASPKLHKAPITKPTHSRPAPDTDTTRHRNDIMYTRDDDQPHAKIDRLVQKHREQKSKEDSEKKEVKQKKDSRKEDFEKKENNVGEKKENDIGEKKEKRGDRISSHRDGEVSEGRRKREAIDTPKASGSSGRESDDRAKQSERKKRPRTDSAEDYVDPGPSAEPHCLLGDVVLVLSGYENPRRACVRTTALALGATVQRDWGPGCTHLICAFPNTPKLRSVRASPGGSSVPVACAEWLDECARLRRRLPWRWFATEPKLRVSAQDLAPDAAPPDPDCDTDEEIEKVLRDQKKRRRQSASPDTSPSASNTETQKNTTRSPTPSKDSDPDKTIVDSDETSVKTQAKKTKHCVRDKNDVYNISTDEEMENDKEGDSGGVLPDFFDGYTFVTDKDSLGEFDLALIERYIRAYGGVLVEASQLEAGSSADFVISAVRSKAEAVGSHTVHPRWLWRCHEERTLVDPASL